MKARRPFVLALGVAIAVLVLFALRKNPGGCAMPAPETIAFDGLDAGPRATPRPSAGCGKPAETQAVMTVDGQQRLLVPVLPAHYDPNRPYPLVLVFHGNGNNAPTMQAELALETAYGDGAIAIYPQAVMRRVWGDHVAPHWGRTEDLPFFDALVAFAKRSMCVDEGRIFVVGWSSGGYFANQLACVRPDVVRAFVALAGGGPEQATCAKAVPGLIHHDRDDPAVMVTEGRASRDHWKARNGCEGSHDEGGCAIHDGCAAPLVYCETSTRRHSPLPARDAAWRFLASF